MLKVDTYNFKAIIDTNQENLTLQIISISNNLFKGKRILWKAIWTIRLRNWLKAKENKFLIKIKIISIQFQLNDEI